MKTQRHIAKRSLSLLGRCAFVHAAIVGSLYGKPSAACTMNEQHHLDSQRPAVSFDDEGWMHPGQGSA